MFWGFGPLQGQDIFYHLELKDIVSGILHRLLMFYRANDYRFIKKLIENIESKDCYFCALNWCKQRNVRLPCLEKVSGCITLNCQFIRAKENKLLVSPCEI